MRRTLLVVALLVLSDPLDARAQPPDRLVRLGFLSAGSPTRDLARQALVEGLRELGYAEGRNVVVESRWADGQFERLPGLAAELVRLKCDVIVASVTQASLAARNATSTIPIVMIGVGDPVDAGLVTSLARPGRNVTGTSGAFTEVVGKQLELLRETFPGAPRFAVLWNPANPVFQKQQMRAAERAAQALRVELQLIEARTPAELERALGSIPAGRPLLLMGDPMFTTNRGRISELAAGRRIAIVTSAVEYAEAGALMAYGPSLPNLSRRAAVYVDKILKGARPADLPVEQPTLFQLVVNLKTARALDVSVPPSVLVRAERTIE
jgi:putative tryptophan/tyrosine transport system substrate-binding protein